jgi:hypothetical protein
MVDYNSLSDIAHRQLLDKGRTVSYKSKNASEYVPGTDELLGSIETSYNVSAVFSDYKNAEIDGTIIKAEDKKLLLSAKQKFTPKTNDIVEDNGVRYRVMNVKELHPGGVVLLYQLQIRR